MKCTVSLIIPIYNSEKNLNRCIHSAVNQTLRDIEIILVDDGSSDSSPEICDSWADKDSRIKVIHKKNGGVASARNAGLDAAEGKYVCFFDSDDYGEKDMFEKMSDKIAKENADICSCRSFFNDTFEEKAPQENIEIIPKKIGRVFPEFFIKGTVSYSVWDSIYKLDVIKKYHIRFCDYKKVFSEDSLFNLMYFLVTKKRTYINEPLYRYYRHENSLMTNSVPGDYIVRHTNLMIELEKFIKDNNLKIKTGSESACLYWDWIRVACSRSKGNLKIVEEDFSKASSMSYFKKKMFSFAFGFAAFKYRKYNPMSLKTFIHLKLTAFHLLTGQFERAAKEYFL